MGDLQHEGEEPGQEGSRRRSSVKLYSAQSAGQRAKAHPMILQTEHWLIGNTSFCTTHSPRNIGLGWASKPSGMGRFLKGLKESFQLRIS